MLSRRLLRIKVVKSVYAHFKSESDSLTVSEKNLISSVDKTYDLYHQMLWLIVDVKRYGEKLIEIGLNKKLPTQEDLHPNTKFVENALITQLETSDMLGKYLEKKGLGWVRYPQLIKNIYTAFTSSEAYKNYMADSERSYKQDAALLEAFYMGIEDNEMLDDVVEEQSILWADDVNFTLIMVLKTIAQMRPPLKDVPLSKQFKNEDDQMFFKELFRKTVVNFNTYLGYIEQFTQNWELDRIAFMDNVIMATAIAELITFPSIPVKVTLDEYIEISKYYSTNGSSLFVNGVLDKVIEVLTKEGKVVKSGRGLL